MNIPEYIDQGVTELYQKFYDLATEFRGRSHLFTIEQGNAANAQIVAIAAIRIAAYICKAGGIRRKQFLELADVNWQWARTRHEQLSAS